MPKLPDAVLKLFREGKEYARINHNEIAVHNATLLQKLSFLYTVLLAGFFLSSLSLFGWSSSYLFYVAFLAVQIGFDFLVWDHTRKHLWSPGRVQLGCLALIALISGFVLCISLFVFPDRPAVYFSAVLVGASALFVMPFLQTTLMVTVLELIFLLGAWLMKTPEAFSYDCASSLTAWLIAIVCADINFDLRLRESRIKAELKQMNSIDELTGVYNKASCEKLCSSYLNRNSQLAPCVLIVFDIDNFKSVNDTLGHQLGDTALRQMAAVISTQFRGEDIVGRIGGDEFIVLMKNTAAVEVAEKKASRISQYLETMVIGGNTDFRISCSMGIAVYDDLKRGVSYEELFRIADQALYRSKNSGKNQYTTVLLSTIFSQKRQKKPVNTGEPSSKN